MYRHLSDQELASLLIVQPDNIEAVKEAAVRFLKRTAPQT
jgi:hypothetical protein